MSQHFMDLMGEWSDATFGLNGPEGALAHLAREIDELRAAPYDALEYADVLMLAMDAARRAGLTWAALERAFYRKLDINITREWGRPDAEGVVEHVR